MAPAFWMAGNIGTTNQGGLTHSLCCQIAYPFEQYWGRQSDG